MTSKEFVKDRYPNAKVVRYKRNDPFNQFYYLCWTSFLQKTRLSEGETQSKAWSNAKKVIVNMDIFNNLRLKEIETREDEIELIIKQKDDIWFKRLGEKYPTEESCKGRDFGKEMDEYQEYLKEEKSELRKLSRERRKIQPVNQSEIPDFGDVMSLKEFIECVESGGFIDYDGYGNYIKNGKQTDIDVYPSDVKNGNLRSDEFTSIIWFNR